MRLGVFARGYFHDPKEIPMGNEAKVKIEES